jgi:alanine racemase
LEEALQLRERFPDIWILTMGLVDGDGLLIASENRIAITLSNFDQIEYVRKMRKPLTVHLKVDTGMHRLGFSGEDHIRSAFEQLRDMTHVSLEGLCTHFSTADENESYYRFQQRNFLRIHEMLAYDFPMIHISNSSSQIKYESEYDITTHTRLGISLYGLTADKDTTFLKNTFVLKTRVGQLNYLTKSDRLGYGATYTATGDEIIAVLPIGYADGFIRQNTGGDVEIRGRRYPIVGRICMDMIFVRVDETVQAGDDVILFGGLISIDEVAQRLDTINYEVICCVTTRVPREYITNTSDREEDSI